MPRHYINDEEVRPIINRLASLVLEFGTVNAVADKLNSLALRKKSISPNRIHKLLSNDQNIGINEDTKNFLDLCLTQIGTEDLDTEQVAKKRNRILSTVAVEVATTGDESEAITQAAERLGLPVGVVRFVSGEGSSVRSDTTTREAYESDWSWQNIAIEQSLRALRKTPTYRAGLVVPTGGGKTRIALTVALRWLAETTDDSSIILWITHRKYLQTQAHRSLLDLLEDASTDPNIPFDIADTARLFNNRIKFIMVQDLQSAVVEFAERAALVIIDEAHHAAAPSYFPIFQKFTAPILLLTATPNRRDNLPIGSDEICFTITYRELIDRSCLVKPIFEELLLVDQLNWSDPEGLKELANYLLDRSESDFKKTLVVVSMRNRAEILYHELYDLLDDRPEHILYQTDAIGFVHGEGTSGKRSPSELLDEFIAWPRGILVATSQLVGEGFDDPSVDTIVVTYPSTSISHLMQVAGRALRANPRTQKTEARIVQMHEAPLDYHINQRWLYQDISDKLRPRLVDREYGSNSQLIQDVQQLASDYNVSDAVITRILGELEGVVPGEKINIMFSGLPYWGEPNTFGEDARWGALVVRDGSRDTFSKIFNDISERTEDLREPERFLQNWIHRDKKGGSLWKSYQDLIFAMEHARREIQRQDYYGANSRPYSGYNGTARLGTTWLRYFTFTYAPSIPSELETFLQDSVNRSEVLREYEREDITWELAVKVILPLAGSITFLLDSDQARWFDDAHQQIREQLVDADPYSSFEILRDQLYAMPMSPIPLRILSEFSQFFPAERFDQQLLRLSTMKITGRYR